MREKLSNETEESYVELELVPLSQYLGTTHSKHAREKPRVHNLAVYPSIGWILGYRGRNFFGRRVQFFVILRIQPSNCSHFLKE